MMISHRKPKLKALALIINIEDFKDINGFGYVPKYVNPETKKPLIEGKEGITIEYFLVTGRDTVLHGVKTYGEC